MHAVCCSAVNQTSEHHLLSFFLLLPFVAVSLALFNFNRFAPSIVALSRFPSR